MALNFPTDTSPIARLGTPTPEPLTVTIPDACRMLGIGRTKIYELIGAGDVRAIRVAGRTLVDVASLRALIAAAPAWKGAA